MSLYKSNRFALLFYLGFLIASVLIGFVFLFFSIDITLYSAFPLYLLYFGGAALLFARREKLSAAELGFRPLSLKGVVAAFALGILLQPGCMMLSYLSDLVFSNPESEAISDMAGYPLPLLLVSVALLPAFFEELICRGVVLHGYKHAPLWALALFPALYFGVLHGNFQQALYACALGAVFACIDRSADSILPSMIAHFTLNGCQITLAWLFEQHPEWFETGEEIIETSIADDLRFYLTVTAVTLPFIAICFRALKKSKPQNAIVSEAPVVSDAPEAPDVSEEKRSSFAVMWPMYLALLFGFALMIAQEFAP